MAVNYSLIPISAIDQPLKSGEKLSISSFCLNEPELLPEIIQYQKLAQLLKDRLSALELGCSNLVCGPQDEFPALDLCACFSPWGSGVPNPDPNPEPPPLECIQDYALPDYFAEDYVCTPQSPIGPF